LLRIRLSRVGKRKQPSYRLVVADSHAPRDGAFLKIIGHYNPRTSPTTLVVKEDDAIEWLKRGAKPSDTAAKLLTGLGVMERAGLAPVTWDRKTPVKPKKEIAAEAEGGGAPAPAAAAPAAAAPAAEAPPAEPEAEAPPAEAEAEAPPAEAEAEAPAEAEAEAPTAEAEAEAPAEAETEAPTAEAEEKPAAEAESEPEAAAEPEPETPEEPEPTE
jgi:small subunit ribosomal protein S16